MTELLKNVYVVNPSPVVAPFAAAPFAAANSNFSVKLNLVKNTYQAGQQVGDLIYFDKFLSNLFVFEPIDFPNISNGNYFLVLFTDKPSFNKDGENPVLQQEDYEKIIGIWYDTENIALAFCRSSQFKINVPQNSYGMLIAVGVINAISPVLHIRGA